MQTKLPPGAAMKPADLRLRSYRTRARRALAVVLLAFAATSPASADLDLVVQGQQWAEKLKLAALSGYLSLAVGQPVHVNVQANPLQHWRRLVAGEQPAVVLEDPHFADYRVTRAGYRIIAAVEGRQSFVLASAGLLLLDPMELAGRPVAALPPPSLSTLQLLAFFPDAVHIPRIMEAPSYPAAARRVVRNEAVAVVLPADGLGAYPELEEMLLMEELPGKAVGVSPQLADDIADRIGSALIGASRVESGRRALEELEISAFVRGHREAYEGFSRLLRGTWGYREIPP